MISLVGLLSNQGPYLEARGPGFDRLNVEILPADQLEVRIDGGLRTTGDDPTRLALHVPRDVTAVVSAEIGTIEVAEMVACDLALDVGAGRITLSQVHGRLRLAGGAGQIAGHAVGGELDIDLTAGDVMLEILELEAGEHTIRLAAGNVRLALAPELAARVQVELGRGQAVNARPASPPGAAAVVRVSTDVGNVQIESLLPTAAAPTSAPPALASLMTVPDTAQAVAFYARAFGARERSPQSTSSGDRVDHAELELGSSRLMLKAEDLPEAGTSDRISLHLCVADPFAVVRRAVEAGAQVLQHPIGSPAGDPYGRIRDPFGHIWSIASPFVDVNREGLPMRLEASSDTG